MCFAKFRTRKARNDFALAYCQQLAHQRQPLFARLFLGRFPIQNRRLKRRNSQWVGDIITIFRVSPGIFLTPSVAYGLREFALESAEEREWRRGAPFLSHEQHWNPRSEQQDRQRSLNRLVRCVTFNSVAESAIADLVVIFQKVDKGSRSKRAAGLAARLPIPIRRCLALIDKAGAERAPYVFKRRALVIAVIALRLAGQQDMPRVMVIIVPLCTIFAARRVFPGMQNAHLVVVVFEHEVNVASCSRSEI